MTKQKEGVVRRSIALKLIRHAESMNNEMYRKANHLFKGGTPDFDRDGWQDYINQNRSSDPGISSRGLKQAEKLKEYLVPHLNNQASHPVRVITSPMRRTLETILPTLQVLEKSNVNSDENKVEVIVNALYHESEGCHTRDKPEPGMNQNDIKEFLSLGNTNVSFDSFNKDPSKGWYAHGKGAETRAESESRAATFYTWLCEYLDFQLQSNDYDLFDAGVALDSEVGEHEHDKFGLRQRRRRTALLIGHGDFMSLILKRIVSGFGHAVENDGIPHRSAFVHFNTGITELEYFGKGRFLIMQQNSTPHLNDMESFGLMSGGGLKDGWSYLMPNDEIMLYEEVDKSFADELDDHVKEQMDAMKRLYLKGQDNGRIVISKETKELDDKDSQGSMAASPHVIFFVKRGLQVVGCLTLDEESGLIFDMVLRPSAISAGIELLSATIKHAKVGGSNIYVRMNTKEDQTLFEEAGFIPVETKEESAESNLLEYKFV